MAGRVEREEAIPARIRELARRRNAVLLAHNYQPPEIQSLADFVGDSLELSRTAAASGAEVIVFCGVHFMAETAAILAPGKRVLLPDLAAGCPMAEMINARELRDWKAQYPGRPVVAYVNTTAEVKAESDICCTSANALRVVESLPDPEILFVPDKNLAAYIARRSTKRVIAWDGYCWVHHRLKPADFQEKRASHPDAEIWVHPECPPEVIDIADRVLSTGQMVAEARKTTRSEVIIGTEATMVYRLRRENPRVLFIPAKEAALCANMKVLTPEKVLRALEEDVYHIQVPPEIAARARGAIEAMIRL